jgi:hypothetical protein
LNDHFKQLQEIPKNFYIIDIFPEKNQSEVFGFLETAAFEKIRRKEVA